MVNIFNNTTKRKLLTEVTVLQQNIERSFSREIGIILNRQFRKGAFLVKSYRLSEVFFAIDAERNKFINIMKKYYIRIAKVLEASFGESTLVWIEKVGNKPFWFRLVVKPES